MRPMSGPVTQALDCPPSSGKEYTGKPSRSSEQRAVTLRDHKVETEPPMFGSEPRYQALDRNLPCGSCCLTFWFLRLPASLTEAKPNAQEAG